MEGIILPLVTLFAKNGSINENIFRRIINNVLYAGVHGVFVAGSQGEFFHWNGKKELGYSKLRLRKLMEKCQSTQVLQQLRHQKQYY